MPFIKYPVAGTGTGKTFVYLPGTSVSCVILVAQYPGYGYTFTFVTIPRVLVRIRVYSSSAGYDSRSYVTSRQSNTNTQKKVHLFMFLSFLIETPVLAAALLQISVRLITSAVLVGLNNLRRACAFIYGYSYLFITGV